jgi:hypothetical protein
MTVSYNASAVKIYSASSSLVRFENKTVFSPEMKYALAYSTLALYVVVNS